MMKQLVMFIALALFWVLLSGKFDLFHLSLGLISIIIVMMWSSSLYLPDTSKPAPRRIGEFLKFIPYSFYLLYEIVLANIHVFYIAFHPNMMEIINPKIVIFKSNLRSDISKFVLANSITLTPGTVTIKIDDDEFIVHALTDKLAEGLPGPMEKKIGTVFGELI